MLAEFASVVDAVQCAVEIQGELKVKNSELPSNRRMQFRIGINLGDVIVQGEQIYLEVFRQRFPLKDQAELERMVGNLRKAGVK